MEGFGVLALTDRSGVEELVRPRGSDARGVCAREHTQPHELLREPLDLPTWPHMQGPTDTFFFTATQT